VTYEGFTQIDNDVSIKVLRDVDTLAIQIAFTKPYQQMKVLMQGLSVFIDPKAKKSTKFALIFPSAREVSNEINRHEQNNFERMQSGPGVNQNDKPDILPLIHALNRKGVKWDVNGKKSSNVNSVIIPTPDYVIIYYAKIPVSNFAGKNVPPKIITVGLLSERNPNDDVMPMGAPPGPSRTPPDRRQSPPFGMVPPPNSQTDDPDRPDLAEMIKPINKWVRVVL